MTGPGHEAEEYGYEPEPYRKPRPYTPEQQEKIRKYNEEARERLLWEVEQYGKNDVRTPEGALKDEIKRHLRSLPRCQFFMPVPGGYGTQTVDFICCINGRYTAVETKAPGKKPTPRQEKFLNDVSAAGGVAFWCSSFESYLGSMVLFGVINQPGGK